MSDQLLTSTHNDNDIILIQVNLTSDKDIDDLEFKISQPDIVSTCYNPKCKTCGQFQQKKVMKIIDGPCWKCGAIIKVATISSSNHGLLRGSTNNLRPSEFTDDEITFAQSKGVFLKTQYSKMVNKMYVANSCNKCDTFVGDHYLFTQYIAPASYMELSSETFDIGYLCEYCEQAM